MQTNEEFQTFMDYVIDQFINIHSKCGNKESSKKEKKILTKFFLSKKDIVSLEIQTFIHDRKNTNAATASDNNAITEKSDDKSDEIEDDMYSAVKKKKKKRKKLAEPLSSPVPSPHPEEEAPKK